MSKFPFKSLTLVLFLTLALPLFAQTDAVTYSIVGRNTANAANPSFNGSMTDDKSGTFQYSFSEIKTKGTIYFKISDNKGNDYGAGAQDNPVLEKDTPFEAAVGSNINMLYFEVVEGGKYTVSFDGKYILLTADEPDVEPEAPSIKYLIAGSFMGSSDNVSYELTPIEGSDHLYSFTFPENTTGILFFMIDAVINGSDNLYYGANGGINTPLVGSYSTVGDTDSKKVGSLFFEMKEDKKYTITFDVNTNTVILTSADATNSPLTISSYYNSAGTEDIIYPEFKIDLTDVATKDYLNNPVTKFEITTWDADMTKRKSIVYSYSADTNEAMTLSELLASLKDTKDTFEYNEATGRYTDKQVTNSRGEYIYTYGDYLYRLYFTVEEEGHTRRYTVYSDEFTVNKDGNPLVLNAFYLIQLGNGESNYLTFIDEDHTYPYSVTDSYGQLGQSNQITFNKADYDEEEGIDFGDENLYKFTDKVLIRSNLPFNKEDQWRIDHCELYIQEEGGKEEIPVVNSVDNRNVLTDGRFMAVVNLSEFLPGEDKTKPALTKPLEQLTYKLKLWYNQGADSNSEGSELGLYEAEVPFTVTLPMPRVENNYIDAFYGTINGGVSVPAFQSNFQYTSLWQDENGSPIDTYDLNGARFHNLRKVLVIKSPNVTLNLGTIMQADNTGGFKYSYKYYDQNGEVVKEEPFTIMAATDDDKLWTVYSDCVLPESLLAFEDGGLYAKEQVSCTATYDKVYPRWTDTDIVRIQIEDNPPIYNTDFMFKLNPWTTRINQSNELVETFTVRLFMFGVNENRVFYPGQDTDTELNMMHNLKDIPNNSNARDYFLVEFVNVKNGEETLAVPDNTEETKPEMVVNVNELLSGKDVRFIYNHHKTADQVGENYLYKDLEVRVSYLYPFNEGDIRRPSSSQGTPAKAPAFSNLKGSVIKSKPTIFGLTTTEDGVFTEVNDLEIQDKASITSGAGYIDINGGYAEIYNLNGLKIAHGEGRHELPKGIYIVISENQRIKMTVN